MAGTVYGSLYTNNRLKRAGEHPSKTTLGFLWDVKVQGIDPQPNHDWQGVNR